MSVLATLTHGTFPEFPCIGRGLRESWVYEVERSFWSRGGPRLAPAARAASDRAGEHPFRRPTLLLAPAVEVERYEEDPERWDGLS